MKIKDITGKIIDVTNLNKTIKQCKLCRSSPFRMDSGHTVGENYIFMLRQLEGLKHKSKT
ncbi:NADH-quinone oxidoreductase subunit F [Dysgonomonas sp. GY617]|uniref:NADH-quinone oxidoreductase subunit F n=1 Tax=Dysgonomonas sp. GY617 TaxID=2780420 RepID=UPI0018834714|nr:NADH-quinone oxidoreductase subunit F [Dysgonomonas sp. GY617]MBF0577192.1 NADH-quinone oxidoreductase subunit F [Dysgonomonas sp. GY617]